MTNPIQSEERRQQIVEKLSAFACEHEAIGGHVPVWVIDYIAIQDDQLATVTQERDARTQEAAQAQARIAELFKELQAIRDERADELAGRVAIPEGDEALLRLVEARFEPENVFTGRRLRLWAKDNGHLEIGTPEMDAWALSYPQLATVTKECEALKAERDTYRQEAAQAQAHAKVMEDALEWPAETCDACGGSGERGRVPDGRLRACQDCGGHEDGLGRGWVLNDAARHALSESSPTAALEAVMQRARAEEREKAATPCIWTEDDDGVWHPACGEEHAFCFNDGGPEHNKVNFCHGCGHPMQAAPYTDENDRAAGLREGCGSCGKPWDEHKGGGFTCPSPHGLREGEKP